MSKSNRSASARQATNDVAKSAKPEKPRPDFPLFVHGVSPHYRWAKKVRGKLHYFGKLADDPEGKAGLAKWLDQKEDLKAGRVPRAKRDGLTVHDACNRFLHAKKQKMESGEVTKGTWGCYKFACAKIKKFFGGSRLVEDLRPEDFENYLREISKTCGLVGTANNVRLTRMVFGYAYKADLIEKPVKFGPMFSQPSARAVRKQRKSRMYEAHEIRRMLDAAGPVMKAMVLLGVNCGFGNGDIERLPLSAVDLQASWVTYPRPKTGSDRRIPLWLETVSAIQEVLADRPKPVDDANGSYVFLTRAGRSWFKDGTRYLSEQFRYFLQAIDEQDAKEAEQNGSEAPARLYRPGMGFYCLRHVHETIAGESRDQMAVDAIMGHERGDMASVYRERISDERLQAVINTVRTWLWPKDATKRRKAKSTSHFRVVG